MINRVGATHGSYEKLEPLNFIGCSCDTMRVTVIDLITRRGEVIGEDCTIEDMITIAEAAQNLTGLPIVIK